MVATTGFAASVVVRREKKTGTVGKGGNPTAPEEEATTGEIRRIYPP